MPKKLNLAILVASVLAVAVFLALMHRGERAGPVVVRGKAIEIRGHGYTLERLAAEIAAKYGTREEKAATGRAVGRFARAAWARRLGGLLVSAASSDPGILAYDPAKRRATAQASLVVYGSLQVGDPDDPRRGETLLLDTVVCGDLRIQVAAGGTLRVHNSTVTTVGQVITAETCSKGYGFHVDGTLEAADSRFLYMSGTQSRTARRNAAVSLKRVTFALADGTAFHTVDADGSRLSIEDSEFRCEGQYGFYVEGSGGEPVELRRCRLFGTMADLFLTGWRPTVDLVDCQFSKRKLFFQQKGGRVAVRWTVRVEVVERGSRQPLAGIDVVAVSTGEGQAETVRARTDERGACSLVLTEYVATPEVPVRQDGRNAATPHRIAARAADGSVLAEATSYDARGPRGRLVLEAPPAGLASR